jgi:hypothetical protein
MEQRFTETLNSTNTTEDKTLEGFFYVWYVCKLFNAAFICRPSNFSVSEDAGLEPGTVAFGMDSQKL